MDEWKLDVPVVLLIFNRPDLTEQVFATIRRARPRKLFVVADGPRTLRDGALCEAARGIVRRVDWDAEVYTSFADSNMGLRRRVSTGLDWVFDQVEQAIILEDDAVPDPSFFPYARELLERFRDDSRVASVTGTNCESLGPWPMNPSNWSYYFSILGLPWGWATWRRAWRNFDAQMVDWPAFQESQWLTQAVGPVAGHQWGDVLSLASIGDSWWLPWTYSCWINAQLSIVPAVNLVSNIGIGAPATNTDRTSLSPRFGNLKRASIELPLDHPPFFVRNPRAEQIALENLLPSPAWKRRIKQLIVEGPAVLYRYLAPR